MYQGKTYEIYDHLVDIALKKERRTYEEFAQEVGLILSNDYHFLVEIVFDGINKALHDYQDAYRPQGYPMISAIVVQDTSAGAIPGGGFFQCAHNLRRLSGWTSPTMEQQFHQKELTEIYRVQQWPNPRNLNLQAVITAE